ncbi:ubiquitin-associated domain-containing protein 2-like [Styela clava]
MNENLGFYKRTISKCLLVMYFTTYVAVNTLLHEYKNFFVYDISKILNKFELWRLLTGKFIFLTPHEFFFGSILLYGFSDFERRFGSYKFMSFILCNWLLTSLLEVAFTTYFKEIKILPSGMYWLIYALLVFYYHDIPGIEQARFGPIRITQKILHYGLVVQIIATDETRYPVCGLGLISGLIYYYNILYVGSFLSLPDTFRKTTENYLEMLLGSTKPTYGLIGATLSVQRQMRLDEIERTIIQNRMQARHRQVGTNIPALFRRIGIANQPNHNVQPQAVLSEESIGQLIDMGFHREEAVNALRMSGNDVGNAAAMLLR